MMRHFKLIAAGLIAAGVLAVGIDGLVLWIQAPRTSARAAREIAYYVSHASDPRVQSCLHAGPGHRIPVIRANGRTYRSSAVGYAQYMPAREFSGILACMKARLHGG